MKPKMLRKFFTNMKSLSSVINGEALTNAQTIKRLFLIEVKMIRENPQPELNPEPELDVKLNQIGNVIYIQL